MCIEYFLFLRLLHLFHIHITNKCNNVKQVKNCRSLNTDTGEQETNKMITVWQNAWQYKAEIKEYNKHKSV